MQCICEMAKLIFQKPFIKILFLSKLKLIKFKRTTFILNIFYMCFIRYILLIFFASLLNKHFNFFKKSLRTVEYFNYIKPSKNFIL